jgi:hypothetical protein
MSEQVFLSRRERREAERKGEISAVPTQQLSESPLESSPSPEIEAPAELIEYSVDETMKQVPQPVEPAFDGGLSSAFNLGAEPVTNSIVIDKVPDINDQILITETGGLIITGSIELPKIDPTTGSIAVISEADSADEALVEDSLNSFVSSVAPLRAAGIAKTRSKTVELTLVNRKGQGQVYAVMSTAVLMITVGALIVTAYMLGFF